MGVVASSPRVTCLAIPPQRFGMSADPLTLRLFQKLRAQHSATGVFAAALASVEARAALLTKCREVGGFELIVAEDRTAGVACLSHDAGM